MVKVMLGAFFSFFNFGSFKSSVAFLNSEHPLKEHFNTGYVKLKSRQIINIFRESESGSKFQKGLRI